MTLAIERRAWTVGWKRTHSLPGDTTLLSYRINQNIPKEDVAESLLRFMEADAHAQACRFFVNLPLGGTHCARYRVAGSSGDRAEASSYIEFSFVGRASLGKPIDRVKDEPMYRLRNDDGTFGPWIKGTMPESETETEIEYVVDSKDGGRP